MSESHGSHSYFDWQVSTLLLAYDVVEPLERGDDARLTERQKAVDLEVHELAMKTIPAAYRKNPGLEFPPAVVMLLTRATLTRAMEIIGL